MPEGNPAEVVAKAGWALASVPKVQVVGHETPEAIGVAFPRLAGPEQRCGPGLSRGCRGCTLGGAVQSGGGPCAAAHQEAPCRAGKVAVQSTEATSVSEAGWGTELAEGAALPAEVIRRSLEGERGTWMSGGRGVPVRKPEDRRTRAAPFWRCWEQRGRQKSYLPPRRHRPRVAKGLLPSHAEGTPNGLPREVGKGRSSGRSRPARIWALGRTVRTWCWGDEGGGDLPPQTGQPRPTPGTKRRSARRTASWAPCV